MEICQQPDREIGVRTHTVLGCATANMQCLLPYCRHEGFSLKIGLKSRSFLDICVSDHNLMIGFFVFTP